MIPGRQGGGRPAAAALESSLRGRARGFAAVETIDLEELFCDGETGYDAKTNTLLYCFPSAASRLSLPARRVVHR